MFLLVGIYVHAFHTFAKTQFRKLFYETLHTSVPHDDPTKEKYNEIVTEFRLTPIYYEIKYIEELKLITKYKILTFRIIFALLRKLTTRRINGTNPAIVYTM